LRLIRRFAAAAESKAAPAVQQIEPAPPLPAHLLANAKVLAHRADILPMLPKGGIVAEIGVALGDFSALLLQACQPSQFAAIDIFRLHEQPTLWGRRTAEIFGGGTHRASYEQRFAAEISAGQMQVMEGDSLDGIAQLADESVSVLYLDADHRYASVAAELAAASPKMRPDGWIVLNDYIMNDIANSFAPYGVVQATHEFMLREGWEMMYLALHPYMYCDVALRRAPRLA
jgi:predicted O-methyltransferase YrrM